MPANPRTQLRLQQLTGSVESIVYSGSESSPTQGTDLLTSARDLNELLGVFAGAIGRITGKDGTAANGFTNQAKGEFSTTIKPDSAGAQDIGSTAAPWGDIFITDQKTIQFGLNQDVTIGYDETTTDDLLITPGGSSHVRVVGDNKELRFNGDNKGISASGTTLALKSNGDATFNVSSAVRPLNNAGADLGTTAVGWNDLYLADDGVLQLGNDQDVTITHVPDVGIEINSDNVIRFRDDAISIGSATDGVLNLNADVSAVVDGGPIVILSASNHVKVENDLRLDNDGAVLGFGIDNDVKMTHVANTGLLLDQANELQFRDAALTIGSPTNGTLKMEADLILDLSGSATTMVRGGGGLSGMLTGSAGKVLLMNRHATDVRGDFHIRNEADSTDADIVMEVLEGTSAASLDISSIKGGILMNAQASGKLIALQNAGANKLEVASSAVNVAAADLTVSTAGKKVVLGPSQNDGLALLHNAGSVDGAMAIVAGSGAASGTESLMITGSAYACLASPVATVISGSGALGFQGGGIGVPADGTGGAGGTFNFVGFAEPNSLLLSTPADAATYKTNFCSVSDVTILGALNALKSDVSASDPDMLLKQISALMTPSTQVQLDAYSGDGNGQFSDATGFRTVSPAKLEVFVNGQQLLSGTRAEVLTDKTRDYCIDVNQTRTLLFSFDLEKDDIVIARDRT